VHPDGRWVFVSNRGHDSIAVFDFDDVERRLIPVGHTPSGGRHPRHFALHPSGDSMLVANRHDDRLVHFEIDRRHGGLTRTGSGTTVSEPVAVTYVEIAR
jgi:6-phosphogluconolactonase